MELTPEERGLITELLGGVTLKSPSHVIDVAVGLKRKLEAADSAEKK